MLRLAATGLRAAAARGSLMRASATGLQGHVTEQSRSVADFKGPIPLDENGGLVEMSVVYTDRALNHMSDPFCKVMNDLNGLLKDVYNARSTVIFPGSGSFAMEAVARQVATDQKVIVLRNGYFSYRWTDIFDQSKIPSETIVLKGKLGEGAQPTVQPHPIDDVIAKIKSEKPAVIFAPHVETSTGVMLPDDYMRKVSDAVHEVGGLFVLDCIASGTAWVDMEKTGVDAIISAPQKGWTGPACAGIVMLSERGTEAVRNTTSSSMVLNLRKWLETMDAYENGGFMYYTTMPTDALQHFRDVAMETQKVGFQKVKDDFTKLGQSVRDQMEGKGFKIVAEEGFRAPGVCVMYTDEPAMFAKYRENGMQIAAGVPFMIDEPKNNTFRLGLFGLDKVTQQEEVLERLDKLTNKVMSSITVEEAA